MKSKIQNLLKHLSLGLCLTLGLTSSVNAALGAAVYDTDLNITWIADANLIASNPFGLSYNTQLGDHPSTTFVETNNQIFSDGSATWGGALHWIDAMNANSYLGFNDWRLPMADASCNGSSGFGYNCTGSEMGHLFYNELGGTADRSALSSGDPDLALFDNFQSLNYWSGLEFAPNPALAWDFAFDFGTQETFNKNLNLFALAVRSGDVAAVPVPAAVWLMGSALLGLAGFRRKRR